MELGKVFDRQQAVYPLDAAYYHLYYGISDTFDIDKYTVRYPESLTLYRGISQRDLALQIHNLIKGRKPLDVKYYMIYYFH